MKLQIMMMTMDLISTCIAKLWFSVWPRPLITVSEQEEELVTFLNNPYTQTPFTLLVTSMISPFSWWSTLFWWIFSSESSSTHSPTRERKSPWLKQRSKIYASSAVFPNQPSRSKTYPGNSTSSKSITCMPTLPSWSTLRTNSHPNARVLRNGSRTAWVMETFISSRLTSVSQSTKEQHSNETFLIKVCI